MLYSQALPHLRGVGLRCFRTPRVDEDPPRLTHTEQRFQLVATLAAGADDQRLLDIAFGQQICRQCPGGAGAQFGQITIVQEERIEQVQL